MQTQTTIAVAPPATVSRATQLLPVTMIAVGLALTAAWIFLLAYGLVTLIELVI
jgi:hypothetical protein